jgi:hypothetical protein
MFCLFHTCHVLCMEVKHMIYHAYSEKKIIMGFAILTIYHMNIRKYIFSRSILCLSISPSPSLYLSPAPPSPILSLSLPQRVLFIGTQFSNLYTVVNMPAKAVWLCV